MSFNRSRFAMFTAKVNHGLMRKHPDQFYGYQKDRGYAVDVTYLEPDPMGKGPYAGKCFFGASCAARAIMFEADFDVGVIAAADAIIAAPLSLWSATPNRLPYVAPGAAS